MGTKYFRISIFTVPLEVTQHLYSKSVPTGAEITFKIKAAGSSLIFQRQKNGRDVYSKSHYSGTDNNILTIQHAKKSDEGQYKCSEESNGQKNIRGSATIIYLNFELIGESLSELASFPGPARSSLAVRNSRRISYCKRRTPIYRAWEQGYERTHVGTCSRKFIYIAENFILNERVRRYTYISNLHTC